jgi:hypothetical protein
LSELDALGSLQRGAIASVFFPLGSSLLHANSLSVDLDTIYPSLLIPSDDGSPARVAEVFRALRYFRKAGETALNCAVHRGVLLTTTSAQAQHESTLEAR